MGLESLESGFFGAFCDTKSISITCWEPYTWGKRFLLFLPDSHSAYYDSFVSVLGQSLPPSLGFQGFVVLKKKKFLAETAGGEGGGWWAHPPTGSGNECGISRHWAV